MNDRLRLILLVMALSVTVALTGCSQPEQNSSIAADDNTTSLQSSIDTVTDTSKTGSITAPEGSELVKTLTDNNNNTVELYGYKSGSDEPFICFISIKDNDKKPIQQIEINKFKTFTTDSGDNVYVYADEKTKQGYRIILNTDNSIKSVEYCEDALQYIKLIEDINKGNTSIEEPVEELPEFYTEDPENEMYLGNGEFVKLADLEADPNAAGSYIIRGSVGGYEYEPFDNNSIRNPDDYDLNEMKCIGSQKGPVVSKDKIIVHEGDSIGSKGLIVDSCYISVAPRVMYSETLKKDIGIGYDVMDAKITLTGEVTFTGILLAERYNIENSEHDGESRILFMPYSKEYHEAVPFLFDVDAQYKGSSCAMFYNYSWGNPQFAITTSDGVINIGYLKDCDFLSSDTFSEDVYYKEATITFSEITYISTERGGMSGLIGTVVSVDNICELGKKKEV